MPQDPLDELVDRALAEDVGPGDVTSEATVPAGLRARAVVTQKAPGVVAGLDAFARVMHHLDRDVEVRALCEEGEWREEGPVVEAAGPARTLLAGERVALNLLGRLSGVATLTRRHVDAVEGTGCRILDTRKTTPGLRWLERRAVVTGGGTNHRTGLYDAVLIKENHAAMAGGVGAAVLAARAHAPDLAIEVECETLEEVQEALEAEAPRILLDDMGRDLLRAAVQLVAGRASLEASGGVSLETIRGIAETGVDFVSVGALTHSAPTLDLSLLLEPLT